MLKRIFGSFVITLAIICFYSKSFANLTELNTPTFVFFADGMAGAGKGNYIAQTAPHANVHFISGDSANVIAPKVKEAVQRGNKYVLMLQNQLYGWKTLNLNPRAEIAITEIKNRLKADNTLSSLAGIYVIDEPYWINTFDKIPLAPQTVYDNLRTASAITLKVFGANTLLISTEAYPILDDVIAGKPWPGFPPEIKLLAVNCYLSFGRICNTEALYLKYMNTLEKNLKPGQNLFLTLDNYWGNTDGLKPSTQEALKARTAFQVNLAKQKNIRWLVSFIYQSVPAAIDNLVGLEQMPILFTYVKEISANHRKITNPSPPTPPPGSSCKPQNSGLICNVDGKRENVTVLVTSTGIQDSKTSNYQLPSGLVPDLMRVEWTCQNSNWTFSHPNGWCSLKRVSTPTPQPPPAPTPTPSPTPVPSPSPSPSPVISCLPQGSALTCGVDGITKSVTVQVTGNGVVGAKTSQYSLPVGLKPVRMQVEWTCVDKIWKFSHPQGWCTLTAK